MLRPNQLLSVMALIALLLGACAEPPAASRDIHRKPDVHVPVSRVEQVEDSALSLAEVLEKGERIYWQSCVNCHGIEPAAVDLADEPQRFVEVVRSGLGTMPGLGFKLNAVEAEMVRWYLDQCNRRQRLC